MTNFRSNSSELTSDLGSVVNNIKSKVDKWSTLFSGDGTFKGSKSQLKALSIGLDQLSLTIQIEFLLYIVILFSNHSHSVEGLGSIRVLAQNARILQLKLKEAIKNQKFSIEKEDMQLTIELIQKKFEKNIWLYLEPFD